ncbi:chromate transporter [Breznakia sp. PF5-3]|uniref:chromate transporter n=1 Tax=unclassified Breznakia TaxID=2623764 RepID=UPI002404BD43|nr:MULTISPECIES: chromate transporter [unclassified Breznakia]MDF9823721.1 chromate transporter [Breznakia sp. PM6-1]MDF9834519.1 chromate transporter [Breznakia sp. PF5-3]MDF9837510.1 chromate transporter [Breznakia sp. PFB2-8]MDF9859087.1 chromate transporter [Breznakia sp. PH5-24]
MDKKNIDWILFKVFLIAGTFTFAGGLAMLPVIEKDIVKKYKLMSREAFLDDAIMAQTIPGVVALNCACFVGKKCNGMRGMLAASLGSILPAFFLMLIATILYDYIPQEGPLQMAFVGVRAASVAFVLAAAITLGKHNLKNMYAWCIMLCSFLLIVLFNIQAPFVIVGAGIFGVFYFSLLNKRRPS